MTIFGVELQVDLWQWIVSQILALLHLALTFYAYSSKSKQKTLFILAICALIAIPVNILLANWIMVWFSVFFLFRNGIFYLLEKRGDKTSTRTSIFILVALSITVVVMTAFVWTHWFDWVLMTGTLATGFGKWIRDNKGVHAMRIAKVYKSCLVIVNSVMFFNFVEIFTKLATIGSIALFYIRIIRTRKTAPKE